MFILDVYMWLGSDHFLVEYWFKDAEFDIDLGSGSNAHFQIETQLKIMISGIDLARDSKVDFPIES